MLHDEVFQDLRNISTNMEHGQKNLKFQYVKDFKPHWSNLSTGGALVVWKNRIFVPEILRYQILKELGKGHQGITRTLQNAR